jgi:hypothetical protein
MNYDGDLTKITYFPDKSGVKLVAKDSPDESEGKKRVIFGVVCVKLLLSGGEWMREL